MKDILLILTTTRQSPAAVDRALDAAKEEGARLIVLFVLDEDIPGAVLGKLSNVDFIGDRPSRELSEAILREYRQRAYEVLQDVEKRASAAGVPCKVILERGKFLEESLKTMEKYSPGLAVVTRIHRSFLSRFFIGSAVEKLKARSPCKLIVV